MGVVAGRCPECSTSTGSFVAIRRGARRRFRRVAQVMFALALLTSAGSIMAHVLTLAVRVWLGHWPNYADTDHILAFPVFGEVSRAVLPVQYVLLFFVMPVSLLLTAS